MARYTIGLDYGTNSVRGLLVDVETGEEIATAVYEYCYGENGIVLDANDPDLARQHPRDYTNGAAWTINHVLEEAKSRNVQSDQVIGIGVDTTGSTPIPVDANGTPLAFAPKYADDPAAMAYLWKDHTAYADAQEITEAARRDYPQYLTKCGGTYSAEWFWAKVLHCRRQSPQVFEDAYTWVELADWIPAVLTDTIHPSTLKRGICAAGHKALFHLTWGGYPEERFLATIDESLLRIRRTLPDHVFHVGQIAGGLSNDWAERTHLTAGIPVSIGAFDCHLGAVGAGIQPNVLVKIIGTSTCDMMVSPIDLGLADIPGLCGIVPESILPNYYGLEAGQSAVGDIFNWFVSEIRPGNEGHDALTEQAARLRPGESGLIALDWHNGNRTVLVDQRLTGGVIGLTLHTTPAEMYRAWIEATAFGARKIMERFEEYGQKVHKIVNCGGISSKNDLVMQIYADVMNRPVAICDSNQTCALGSAIAGAMAAGVYSTFSEAMVQMSSQSTRVFSPHPENSRVYDALYALYAQLHDAFSVDGLADVMKSSMTLRDEVRHGK